MFAFTLAEVLITLVIIGVIAAITVPSLINKTNNQETVSKLKKAYSTLAQATNRIIAEEGSPKGSNTWISNSDNIYNLYKKNLVYGKDCGKSNGCFPANVRYQTLSGNNWIIIDDITSKNKISLADGTLVMFEEDTYTSSDCNKGTLSSGSTNVCAFIFVDINGAQKPNKKGRDLFTFVLKENGLYPRGCESDSDCNKNNTGDSCACKILREGAMNY